jgi:AcrR family transcriptional regulator
VAREAGVSPAAPYHHFDDRDAMLAAVAAEGFGELGTAMQRGVKATREKRPLRRLQAAGVAYVRFAVTNPQLFRLMFSGLLGDRAAYPELQRRASHAFGILQQLLGGRPDAPPREPPLPAALAAWATVHGLAMLLIDGRLGQRPTERRAARIARDVTRVLGTGLRTYEDSARS